MSKSLGLNTGAGASRDKTSRPYAALLLMLLLQLPLAGMLAPGPGVTAQIEREVFYWACALLLITYVLVVERRPLASIGLHRPTWRSLAYGLLGATVMIAGFAFIYLVIYPTFGLSDEVQNAAAKDVPFALLFLIVIRAAVFEELLYRGFAIERLTQLTGLRWLAAVVSLTAFTYAHLGYWGWAHLLIAGFGGLVMTLMYVWRRDLAATMIAHFLTDAVGFLLGAV